eukprot:CAMPEP_0197539444 /NCGR_PEP_ID=MMETSP1318-20131121/62735_1 /TAXON_ID=552666 /ORGANISM="Partenskyella glossopodia, Strain RCC365" /LENGTH=407 /DNA_ID=CAMNT_0043098167 /DNA_START=225 /DNA_END=1449 /DNA_ORIENTATION=+
MAGYSSARNVAQPTKQLPKRPKTAAQTPQSASRLRNELAIYLPSLGLSGSGPHLMRGRSLNTKGSLIDTIVMPQVGSHASLSARLGSAYGQTQSVGLRSRPQTHRSCSTFGTADRGLLSAREERQPHARLALDIKGITLLSNREVTGFQGRLHEVSSGGPRSTSSISKLRRRRNHKVKSSTSSGVRTSGKKSFALSERSDYGSTGISSSRTRNIKVESYRTFERSKNARPRRVFAERYVPKMTPQGWRLLNWRHNVHVNQKSDIPSSGWMPRKWRGVCVLASNTSKQLAVTKPKPKPKPQRVNGWVTKTEPSIDGRPIAHSPEQLAYYAAQASQKDGVLIDSSPGKENVLSSLAGDSVENSACTTTRTHNEVRVMSDHLRFFNSSVGRGDGSHKGEVAAGLVAQEEK